MTESPDRQLRVSDDERSHVMTLLEKATGRGLIDIGEFSTRSESALAAKTRGELNAVVVDLPGMVNTTAPVGTRGAASSTLCGSMTAIHRDGAWTVPQVLDIRNSMSPTKLDFRQAKIDHRQVELRLNVNMGAVKLWLPTAATVNTEHLEVMMGSIKGRGLSSAEQPGNPHFVISGRIMMGSLKVYRGGRWF